MEKRRFRRKIEFLAAGNVVGEAGPRVVERAAGGEARRIEALDRA